MKILKNPTDNLVRIRFAGKEYEIMPSSTIEVSDELAIFWSGIHSFLNVGEVIKKESESVEIPQVVETPKVEKPKEVSTPVKKSSKKK